MRDLGRWTLPEQACVDVGRLLFGLAFRLRVEGLRHVPASGGALLLCNHPTLLDPVLLTLAMDRAITHVADRTPWRYPAVGYFLDVFHCIPLERGANPVATVRQAVRVIRDGRIVSVFPEGGLSDRGQVRPFQAGAARIALDARCPVIPAAICGSYAAWPQGHALPRLRPVTVRFGPAVDLARAYARPRSGHLLRCVAHEMRLAVQRLYTPWDPRAVEA